MSELAGIPLLFLIQHLLVASYLHVVVVTVRFQSEKTLQYRRLFCWDTGMVVGYLDILS